MVQKFRKRPVVIEAIQLTQNNYAEVKEFVGETVRRQYANLQPDENTPYQGVIIQTLEGEMLANIGDYIIKGIKGEYYPCKPDIFESTYEIVTD
jgi:hypothetical protein